MIKKNKQVSFNNSSLIIWGMSMALVLSLASRPVSAESLFEPYQATAVGSYGEAVAIGDINGDGRNDVVMTTSYSSLGDGYKLFIFLQDIDGNLQDPQVLPLAADYTNRPLSVDIGDMNNDGRQDVVVGNDNVNLQIFLQNTSGELDPPQLYPTTRSMKIQIGDLNGDQKQDIAGIDWGGADVAVALQNESGLLDPALFYPAPHAGYDDLEIGDVNDDGLLDLVVMSGQTYSMDNLAILTQDGMGGFNPVSSYDFGNVSTHGVTVGDLNGDGRNDVAVTYGGNRPNSFVGIFFQDDTGSLGAAIHYPSYDIPEPIQAADVNGDDRDDLVVLHGGWSRMGVYRQLADGSLAAEELIPIPYASHYNPHGLAVGDINGDSAPDVVIADYNNGLVVLYHSTPNLPPVADAGSDQTVVQKTAVILDGSGSSDPDGLLVGYSWQQVAGIPVTLTPGASPAIVSFVAPTFKGAEEEMLVFQLTVTDDNGESASDSQVVTVARNSNKR